MSLNELATKLGAREDGSALPRLAGMAFVIVRLGGFTRNLREEVTSKANHCFFDNGNRNAIITQFNGLDQRNRFDALWDTFVFFERLKPRARSPLHADIFFWRKCDQQGIDLVEERGGKLLGYGFKWSLRRPSVPPPKWLTTYPHAEFALIRQENYLDFALPDLEVGG